MRVKHFARKVSKKFTVKKDPGIRERETRVPTRFTSPYLNPIRRECLASTAIPAPIGMLRDMFAIQRPGGVSLWLSLGSAKLVVTGPNRSMFYRGMNLSHIFVCDPSGRLSIWLDQPSFLITLI